MLAEDSHPAGPHFGVLVAGFAHVEVGGRRVSRLKAGALEADGFKFRLRILKALCSIEP